MDPCATMSAMMPAGAPMVKRTAFWSRRTRRTVPVPSMCPETMCPPKRPSAAMARSRFTGLPARSAPRLECESVCGITSAANPSANSSVAVRHTPLTAMLSPMRVPSSTRDALMASRPARPAAGTLVTRPVSSTMPVNMIRLLASWPPRRAHCAKRGCDRPRGLRPLPRT